MSSVAPLPIMERTGSTIGATMSEATRDIQDNLELEARVGALLDELAVAQAAAEKLSDLASPPPAPPPTAATNGTHKPRAERPNAPHAFSLPQPAPSPDATAVAIAPVPQIKRVTETADAAAAASRVPAPETAPQPEPAPEEATAGTTESEQDLAAAVTKLIDQGAPASADAKSEPSPAPAPPPVETGKIESLDAELAGLADDLIAGEFADEETVLKEAAGAGSAAPAPSSTPTVVATEAATKPEEPKAAPAATLTAKPKTDAEPTEKKRETLPAVEAKPSSLLRVAAAVSSPLQTQPVYMRGIVAWFALVTAFLAMCVWAWVLVFRPPEAPVPAPAQHADKSAEHGEKKAGGHEAKKPTKTDIHAAPATKKKAPAKNSHGTQAKASGGH